jgi:hypothetical protein
MRCAPLLILLTSCSCRPTELASPPEAPATEPDVVELVLTFDDGAPDSQLVPARTATAEGYLALDTGSASTFLYDPDEREGQVTIGARTTLTVSGRDLPPETFAGKPILGVLGADFLLAGPSELDYPGRRIVRHRGRRPCEHDDGCVVTPFLDAEGHIAVRVEIDGAPKLLMLDTGSRHTLLVGESGRGGDERAQSAGIDGLPFDVFVGTSELTLAGERREVPVLRASAFPYFESFARELHPDLAGLLGLTSIGFRRIVIDPEAHVLRLGPLERVP